tara:strand:- start:254 stop:628 length:375 start_codon:yes stop_codon:yes gene_type:complete
MRIFLILFLMCSNAYCINLENYYKEPLTEKDKSYIVASTILQGIDMLQTLEIANNDDYYETNPILGKHPSELEVITYFVARAFTLSELTKMTPQKYRGFTHAFNIVYNFDIVRKNHSIGIRIGF